MKHGLLCATLLSFGWLAGTADAALVYREIFSANLASGEPLLANSGWDSRWSSSASTLTSNLQVKIDGGPTPNLASVNSSPVWGANIGRTYQRPTGGTVPANSPFITWTSEHSLSLSAGAGLDDVRFWERHSLFAGTLTHDTFRFVLEVGGAWYVTDQSSALTGASSVSGGDGTWYEQALDLSNASWRTLSFTPGSTLSAPGSSVSLPTGTMTSFGFYQPACTATHDFRFDSIELYVPEPSACLLMALMGLVLTRRMRPGMNHA